MALKSNSIGKSFMWVIMGLLFIGLAGFGATGLSGTIRTVGTVGDKSIPVNDYARALQQEMNALSAQFNNTVTFQQAQALGIDRQVLGRIVTTRALDHEATEMGLSIGDENLRKEVLQVPAFQGPDGKFDREAYRFAINNANLSESEFEQGLREDTSRTILQGAILAGIAAPDTYTDAMVQFIGERRAFSWAALAPADLAEPVADPDDAALKAFYDENIDSYTLPRTKRITYAWLTPEMLVGTVEVDDTALREEYEKRNAEFNQPERRLVERLVFADQAAANDAKAQLEVGGTSFEALVEGRGLQLSDVDLGDVAKTELNASADAVFGADVEAVVGPFETSLGPALFRVNGVLAAQSTSFEEAEAQLRDELAQDRARRAIAAQAENINDLLAGGATLEDLKDETDMELGNVDWHDGVEDGIAAYNDFRQAASDLTVDDFPEVLELEDGAIFAMRLDEVVDPRAEPLDEVRERAVADWRVTSTRDALRAQAEDAIKALGLEGDFAAAGLSPSEQDLMIRSDFVEGLPRAAVEKVFELDAGAAAVVDNGEGVIVLRLNAVEDPEADNPDLERARSAIAGQAANGIAQDLFEAFANDVQSRAGVSLDQRALNAVHANF